MQLSTQKEKKKSGFLVFTSSTNVKLESSVNVVVVQAKKARTWTLFCKSTFTAFLPFGSRYLCRRRCLSLRFEDENDSVRERDFLNTLNSARM